MLNGNGSSNGATAGHNLHARGSATQRIAAAVHRGSSTSSHCHTKQDVIPNGAGSGGGHGTRTATANGSSSHDAATVDNTKYNMQMKRKLRRKKLLRSGRGGFFSGIFPATPMGRWMAATIWLLALGLFVVIYHRRQSFNHASVYNDTASQQKQRQTETLERWNKVENLWRQRHEKEFDGVAPHAPKVEKGPKENDIPIVQKLQAEFDKWRWRDEDTAHDTPAPVLKKILLDWLEQENADVSRNVPLTSPRWIRPYLLPPLPNSQFFRTLDEAANARRLRRHVANQQKQKAIAWSLDERANFFRTFRQRDASDMAWHDHYLQLLERHGGRHGAIPGPTMDYTLPHHYSYPPLLERPPLDGSYPPLAKLETLMQQWPQDEDFVTISPIDGSKRTIRETLQHFNYSDPVQLKMATLFRDAELPFKLYGVPDVDAASHKWTDDYVAAMFGDHASGIFERSVVIDKERVPLAKGTAQESRTNYFAFFVAKAWDLAQMGLAPTRNNDWSYQTWAQHAVYADAVSLSASQPHFYWQSGVPPEERHLDKTKWCFISRDLPSLSSAEENFFVFHVQEQKGIQCRFGERGVVAATHFDGGRNMVAMLKGAKRYILSPPNQCSKLGIFTEKRSPIYRHSLLNFGHIPHLRNASITGMSKEERAWLERAASSQALETVLKQGEVLYIPSHWFHYIVSLQKSAQCNVRSGIDQEGTVQFGGRDDVEACID
jgi:Cupin-like domain